LEISKPESAKLNGKGVIKLLENDVKSALDFFVQAGEIDLFSSLPFYNMGLLYKMNRYFQGNVYLVGICGI
jgi:hypothetical protein